MLCLFVFIYILLTFVTKAFVIKVLKFYVDIHNTGITKRDMYMFNEEINKLEEMMVDYCEYNPMIFAQKSAFENNNQQKKTFTYGNFSLKDYIKAFSS